MVHKVKAWMMECKAYSTQFSSKILISSIQANFTEVTQQKIYFEDVYSSVYIYRENRPTISTDQIKNNENLRQNS